MDYLQDGVAAGHPAAAGVFHGLEGSSRSHYCEAFADGPRARLGLRAAALPGCSGEINRAPRAYHSGDHAEIGWMLEQLRAR